MHRWTPDNLPRQALPKQIRNDLPPLVAPAHLRGKMQRWMPEELRRERMEWAVRQGEAGYSSGNVGDALGISQRVAHRIMVLGGWDAWAEQRERARA